MEVIVRGYISGVTSTALWYRYALGEREIYGYTFPDGLRKEPGPARADHHPHHQGRRHRPRRAPDLAEVVTHGLLDAATWDQVQAAALALFERGQASRRKPPG